MENRDTGAIGPAVDALFWNSCWAFMAKRADESAVNRVVFNADNAPDAMINALNGLVRIAAVFITIDRSKVSQIK